MWEEKLKEGQRLGYFDVQPSLPYTTDDDLVIGKSNPKCAEANMTGGKGSSLAILSIVHGVAVPDFFVVSTKAFKDCLSGCVAFQEKLSELESLSHTDQQVPTLAKALKQIVMQINFSDALKTKITEHYNMLCSETKRKACPVAVRSSATTEDTADASFAGQHSTYLNQIGIKDILQSVRRCWASVFNHRAVEYRNRLRIPHEEALVAVVVQAMVEPIAAGTGFSVEIATGFCGLHVAAAFGLGEGVVSGDVTSDEWLFQPTEPFRLIKKTKGSKSIQYIRKADGSGIERVNVPEEQANTFCLDTEKARDVAMATKHIAAAYKWLFGYEQIDTEFAVSKEKNLFLLQARCVVPSVQKIYTVASSVTQRDVILRGKYALMGAVHGKVKVIERFEDLVAGNVVIEPDDIVVAVKTGNYWNQFLKELRGIVTVEGSPTAHPMLIGRERNIPCVIGAPNALDCLKPFHGQWVTLDGLKKSIYVDKQPLVHASEDDIRHRFSVVEDLHLPSDEQSKKYLLQSGRAIVDPKDPEVIWVANPDHTLPPTWLELSQDSYALRTEIILNARNEASRHSLSQSMQYMNDTTLVLNNKVYDYIRPLCETMRVFDEFSLDECEQFVNLRNEDSQEYLKACQAFRDDPCVSNWEKYEEWYKKLNAHKWLSWFFRSYLELQMTNNAQKVGCSQLHFEEMQEQIQNRISDKGDDLDRNLASELENIATQVDTSIEFEKQSQEIQDRIAEIATNYRITKNSNIALDAPVQEVWKKCKSASRILNHSFGEGSWYYPEESEFVRSVILSIHARIQHCNSHHWLMKGQFIVRNALLALGLQSFDCSRSDLLALVNRATK